MPYNGNELVNQGMYSNGEGETDSVDDDSKDHFDVVFLIDEISYTDIQLDEIKKEIQAVSEIIFKHSKDVTISNIVSHIVNGEKFMITGNDYPMFTYFMQCYMCDSSNYLEQAKDFLIYESSESSKALCKEVLTLMKCDKYDIQSFIKRTCKRKYSINELNIIFDAINYILEDI